MGAWIMVPLLSLALAGCGQQSGGSVSTSGTPAAETTSANPAPAPTSPAIQKIYDTTCKTCHSKPESGAPQAGDAKAWAPRLAQGKSVLIDHAVNGFQKMPPMGMCMQCSEDDFAALIEYMSGSKLQ
jgi:cytochrome c5